jgi:hypothetical protein
LLGDADIVAFKREVEPALFWDAKLDLAAMLRPLA